jgi:hypothetical protein
MNKNDEEIKYALAKLIESFEGALEIIVGAVARTGDADKLHAALERQITIAKSGKLASPLAIDLATSALAVVEAVRLENQANDPDQHKH